jgi:pilus assembly protein CpaD
MPQPLASGRHRLCLLPAAALLAASLAACTTVDREVPTASVPADYHLRHPVVLAEAPDRLDIFTVGGAGRLDDRSLHDLAAFVAEYRLSGHGPIVVRAPEGPVDRFAVERTVQAVRHALIGFGARGGVEVVGYPVADPRLASPLHLSFTRMQARLASRCGDWPDDLNSGASLNGWQNRSYYNLGCASAKTLAAQIDDPRDIVSPRPEDPSDVQLRTRAIGLLRGTATAQPGKDPGTVWTGAAPTPISNVGGN